jgi:hypothetical protein
MKLQNKKGFLLRDIVVVTLIFGLVVSLYIIYVGSVANSYHNTDIVSDSFAEHYSKLSSMTSNLDTSNKAVQGGSGLNLIGTFNVAFNSVFTVFAMVGDSILLYTGFAQNAAGDFTFFDYKTVLLFLTSLVAILVAYQMFIWLSSVTRGKI